MSRFGSPYRDMADRLLANSVEVDGCWIWLGHRTADGYGRITVWQRGQATRRVMQAHRVAYETFIGPVPADHDLDHRSTCCRACIHPNHVTPRHYREHRRLTGFSRKNKPVSTATTS